MLTELIKYVSEIQQTKAKLKFTGLKVPDFTFAGEDEKANEKKLLGELMKIAGFFSKKFEVPRVKNTRDQELNRQRLGNVKENAERMQKYGEYVKKPENRYIAIPTTAADLNRHQNQMASSSVVTPNASQVIDLVIKTYKEEKKASVTFVINDGISIELTKEALDNILSEAGAGCKLTQDDKKQIFDGVYFVKVLFYSLFFVIRFFLCKLFLPNLLSLFLKFSRQKPS